MSPKPVRVLLLGASAKGISFLLQRLEKRGCDCYMATSTSEAARLSVEHVFDLVLCTGHAEGIDAFAASLIGSPTSLFRCYPVEDGCWWLPAVRRGERCPGAPALRPSDFASALDRIVEEIKSGKHPAGGAAQRGEGEPCYAEAAPHSRP